MRNIELARTGAPARPIPAISLAAVVVVAIAGCGEDNDRGETFDPVMVESGREVFRHDTFGDEVFWTDTLQMHTVISTAVTPMIALGVGLKVDADAVPPDVLAAADLTSPATTVALLKLNAVVGVKGTVMATDSGDQLMRVGITCALCHSTVDDSVMPGIGKRVDGPANRDLDPGAIIALSPAVPAEAKAVYMSWGPGKYDPRFNADMMNGPVLIPPVYGLKDSPHATYTGDGDISYWNNYVAVTQMGGIGNFRDERIGVMRTVPAGATDQVTPKLPALRAYQFSLNAPAPAATSFDAAAAGRGQMVFDQSCARCHGGPGRTTATLFMPSEVGADATYANRSASKRYRATPLRGLAGHAPYVHDGSAATLEAVVDRYDGTLNLGLSAAQKGDLVEFLKSI
jgi:mono/diheme cytochrome c family protein